MERPNFSGSARVLADLNPNIEKWNIDHKRRKSTRGPCCRAPWGLDSKTEILVESAKENGASSTLAKSVPPGTGIYFCDASSESIGNSEGICSDLQNLVTLTLVACDLEASSKRHQYLKKRRTPRNMTCLKRFLSDYPERKLPRGFGGRPSTTTQRHELRNLDYYSEHVPPAPELVSALESSDVSDIENELRRSSPNVKPLLSTTDSKALATLTGPGAESYNRPVHVSRPPQTSGASLARNFAPHGHVLGHETRVQRFAKKVLQFVGEKTIPEKFIRKSLGNNPDTSKALRLLLKQQKMHRVGEGGRGKAFEYVVTSTGLAELEGLKLIEAESEQATALPLTTISQAIPVM